MVGPESPGALKETVTPDAATRSSRVSTHFVIAAAIVLGAAAVRVPGLFSDFWLDEIWSLDNALAAASWTDIFRIRFDNNHHLNSLYLWLIGDGAPLPVYRLPAFAAGIASVVAARALAAREGRFPAIVTCVTFSLSYLLVYYSSEARGYALVVLFSLAGWLVVQRHAERPSKGHILVLAACAVLGVMAHRTFVLFLVGAYVWFDVHAQRRYPIRQATRLTWSLFALPAVIVAVGVIALRNTTVGGGPAYWIWNIYAKTASTLVGGPASGTLMWIVAAIVAGLFVAALVQDIRAGDDRWIFYGTTVVIVPVILGLFGRPETVSPRYLIVPAAFALLSISISVGRGLEKTGRIRLLALVSTALLVGLGLTHFRPINRGQYRSAIGEMLAATTSEPVTVASGDRFGGHAFRTTMVLNFYRRRMTDGPRVSYIDANRYPTSGAEWMIVESPDPESASPVYRDRFGRNFRLQQEYLASEISGVTWHLYRRADDRPSSR